VQLATDAPNTWRDWTPQSTGICWTASGPATVVLPNCTGHYGKITVNNVPAFAKVWVTVHLDYVRKGTTPTPASTVTNPRTYGPFQSAITMKNSAGAVVGTSYSSTTLLGRGKKVTVVYGTMRDASGNAMSGVYVRIAQGTTSAILLTDSLGGYVLFDGQGCSDGLEACATGSAVTTTGSFAFKSGNNQPTTVAVLGTTGTLGTPPPPTWPTLSAALPPGKTSATVSWPTNNTANLGATPSYTFNVTYGSAYVRDWKFN
jgi:hypothetical protein